MKSEKMAAQHVMEMDGMKRIAPIVAESVKSWKVVTNATVPGILMNK